MFATEDLVDISQSAGGDISRAGYDVVTAYERLDSVTSLYNTIDG